MNYKRREIGIITPGVLPVPCSKGGAVENLVDFYLRENEKYGNFIFHVVSIFDEEAKQIAAKYKYSKFYFFKPQDFFIRLKRSLYSKMKKDFYYNSYLDYYGYWAINVIKKCNIDLIIIENRQGFILDKSLNIKCPTILHLHNDSLNSKSLRAKEILEKYDKIITVSSYIKKQVDTICPNDKTVVVYNGIEINRFLLSESMYTRKKWGLDDNDFIVVYAGRLMPIKGIRELLQAFILLKDYPDIKLLVVGGNNLGEQKGDPFEEELNILSREISSNVVFTGYIPYEKISYVLRLGNIGIVPSICEEAFSLSSVECMASGLPLIVTRAGGIPEVVDENCAVIVEKDENLIKSISNAVVELYKNKERLKIMSEKGKLRSKLFSHLTYSQKFLVEIENML